MYLFKSKKHACGRNYKNERGSEHEHELELERESKSQVEIRRVSPRPTAPNQRSRMIEKTDAS